MPEILVTGVISNQTSYSFVVAGGEVFAGQWVEQPQPVPAMAKVTAFSATGAAGESTGAAGYALYDVLSADGTNLGTAQVNFSDPYLGNNTCSAATTVPGLGIAGVCPQTGSTFTITWNVST